LEKVISAEMSFLVLGSLDYSAPVRQVLDLINASGLQYEVGPMSTFVTGEAQKILGLIGAIYEAMEGGNQFVLEVKLSNTCGCQVSGRR
jgi:uncharacterized protein YqgV (UPF0045/DUF77 family)